MPNVFRVNSRGSQETSIYEFAFRNKKDLPENWLEKNMAGIDWFQGFMKRHKQIFLRQPEATSIARASSFNQVNVSRFFDLLEDVKSRYSFEAKDILNIDETGCMMVHKCGRVVAPTGAKHRCIVKCRTRTDGHAVLCKSMLQASRWRLCSSFRVCTSRIISFATDLLDALVQLIQVAG